MNWFARLLRSEEEKAGTLEATIATPPPIQAIQEETPATNLSAHQASAPATAGGEPAAEELAAIEQLNFDSNFSGFLSPEVSDGLRRAALRKLFHSSEFNIVDGLDEYAEDYTQFQALGDIITADMRHHMARLAKQQNSEPADAPATENASAVMADATDSSAVKEEAAALAEAAQEIEPQPQAASLAQTATGREQS